MDYSLMDSVKASVRAQWKSQIPTKVMIALFSRFAEHYRGGIVPELLQNNAQPPRITPIALKLLQSLDAWKSQQEELEKV